MPSIKKRGQKIILPEFSKEKVKKIWREKFGTQELVTDVTPFKNFVLASVVVNIVIILFIALGQGFLPPEVPLFYGMPEGQMQVSSKWFLLMPSSLALVFIVINLVISSFVKEKDDFLKRVLILGAITMTLFSIVTTVKIFFLVGGI
ncbi:hypothetical protein M1545_03600 [Patescibacteria group bacterium]|nr:hypothetical protein [Patescibacteria group bacterium]